MLRETQALDVVLHKKKVQINAAPLRGFIAAELLDFELHMCVQSFDSVAFVPCGTDSDWLRIATHDGSALLLLSFSLWSFLKRYSHEGAYGTEGAGYLVIDIDGSPMVIVKKIAIDVEQMVGFHWNAGCAFFSDELRSFTIPYGTRVNVGEYTLTPYNYVTDEYGYAHGEIFTKWRVQASEEFFGVHCLEGENQVFAMIPSVVVQVSCPQRTTRHLNYYREEHEGKWARRLVERLRAIGLHARDVHSEHHGIVILNIKPDALAGRLQDCREGQQIIRDYDMGKWLASYKRTFPSAD